MRHNGTVKWYNQKNGFGFISRDGLPDVVVFAQDLDGVVLSPGDHVEFLLREDNERGPAAYVVQVVVSSTALGIRPGSTIR